MQLKSTQNVLCALSLPLALHDVTPLTSGGEPVLDVSRRDTRFNTGIG